MCKIPWFERILTEKNYYFISEDTEHTHQMYIHMHGGRFCKQT